jgi:hypothetical protein
MSLPITIPNTFATESTNIPLSDLDANFTTVATAINGIGSGTEALANVAITGGTMTNVTANTVSISNVAVTGGTITGITDLAVADGGTGSGTASGARTNLGAAASGSNSDITSLSGLTTALSIAQGGTGANTAATARTSLGLGTLATQSSVTAAQVPSGSVVQTQYAQYTSSSSGGSSWGDTGITVNITPSSTSNKVLVRVCFSWSATDATATLWRLVRNSTVVGAGSSGSSLAIGTDSFVRPGIFSASFEFLDSPSSTSALTYKLQGIAPNGGNVWVINQSQFSGGLSGYTSTSSITAQEIVG